MPLSLCSSDFLLGLCFTEPKQYHNNAPTKTAATALPTPIPIFAGVCSPAAPEGLEESVGAAPSPVVVLDKFADVVSADTIAAVVTIWVVTTVMTEPPLSVDRDVDVVREAAPLFTAVEVETAMGVVPDDDNPGAVWEQYTLKLGKQDDWGYTAPSCIMAWIGESAAVKARVAEV